jgi:hypothetical protein
MEDKKFKDAMKAKEKEMKDEKEAERQVHIVQVINGGHMY